MEVRSLGSGFLISSDGYIVTNDHVAGNASKVVVTLTNGEKYDAEIIGSDPVSDVALLKIKGKNLPFLTFANSDEVIVGEWSIAFGNPFGLFDINARPTVTVGVVSNVGVSFSQENRVYKNMIQTDAAISSGNSGGPLLNARGEVIGVNTVIYSTSQSSQGAGSIGIGFAVPINRVKKIAEQLKEQGKIDRDFNPGLLVQQIDDNIAKYFKLDKTDGVVVIEVKTGSAAEKAGIEPGDIILKVDNTPIHKDDDLVIAISDGVVGQTLKIELLRSGETLTKKLYLNPIKR
jgi:serine protease Do